MTTTFFERSIGRSGEVFRERRMELGRDALDFSRELRIPLRYITALEQNAYCDVPMAFTKHWLRSYAEALGLGWETMGQRIMVEWERAQRACELPRSSSHSGELIRTSKVRAISLALAATIAVYIGAVVAQSFLPPPLAIVNLPSSSEAGARSMRLTVSSLPETTVIANGEQLRTNRDGNAEFTVALSQGENTVVLRAHRRHSGDRVVQYHIYAH